MAIPKYYELFQPVLVACADGEIHKVSDLVEKLADKFGLSHEERTELLPSGRNPVFKNRVWWARTFLKKAELLMAPVRGSVQITQLGKDALEKNTVINLDYLKSLPNFEANWGNEELKKSKDEQKLTPEEMMEQGYKELSDDLVQEVLDQVRKNVTPISFEQLVVELLLKMGYGGSRKDAGIAVGKSGDGGIDGLIKEDRLGLNKIYIQAKHWESNVGDVEIGRFLGSLAAKGATKGVFITTSDFTAQAKNTIANSRASTEIILINGEMLASLMIEYDLGVSTVETYRVKRVDSDYFI